MKKAMIVLGLVMVMLFGVSYVYAQEKSDPPRHGWIHGEKSWGQGKRLNLTPEQKARFQELRRKFIVENAQLIGDLVAKRLELRSLWTDPKADSQAILAKERELRGLKNRMKDKIVQYRLEARNSLTPEQIEKLGSIGGIGRRGMMGHGWGMGHPGMWQ
jgi:Spy/CpxP family protein refolding chaperone